jgi:hypothetical protein
MTAGGEISLGDLAQRIGAELADAADICRRAEDLAAGLAAEGGAALDKLSPLQSLDELTQRLSSLAAVLEAIADQSPPSWTLNLRPLLAEVRLSAMADRLIGLPPTIAVTGEADFF